MYAIPLEMAEKHQIRRYGFQGISHRYLLERYAFLTGQEPGECNIVHPPRKRMLGYGDSSR